MLGKMIHPLGSVFYVLLVHILAGPAQNLITWTTLSCGFGLTLITTLSKLLIRLKSARLSR